MERPSADKAQNFIPVTYRSPNLELDTWFVRDIVHAYYKTSAYNASTEQYTDASKDIYYEQFDEAYTNLLLTWN